MMRCSDDDGDDANNNDDGDDCVCCEFCGIWSDKAKNYNDTSDIVHRIQINEMGVISGTFIVYSIAALFRVIIFHLDIMYIYTVYTVNC